MRVEPYLDDTAGPFFSNLLPEGEVRSLIAKIKQISEHNDFKLLESIGGECAGAVSIVPEHTILSTEIDADRFYLTFGVAPRSHILKPQSPYFGDVVQNEYFCMRLADAVELAVPGNIEKNGYENREGSPV